MRHRRAVFVIAALAAAATPLLLAERAYSQKGALERGEWHDYAGDGRGMKYSPLAQIDADNVKTLRIAWRWQTADRELQLSDVAMRASRYQDTPLVVNGTLYTVTSLGFVAALDPGTGAARWVYDTGGAKAGRPHSIGHSTRGLMYWTDGARARVYHAGNDGYLWSIDAKTGLPDPAFGENGKVDVMGRLPNAVRARNFTARRGVVAGDVVVVGSAIVDAAAGKEGEYPAGEVRAYDAKSGKQRWTFHLIPKKSEFGYETWLEGSAERTGNTNAWPGMAYDAELDYVYVPTSNPGSDYYGAERPGDNLFGDSLVCLEAKTGKRVWHFQAHHHAIWDYDFPMHPALGELTVNGRRVKAVIIANKTNFIYAFDRATGQPMWPIVERPVPQSTTKNRERTSATQPIPTKPPAIDMQGSLPEHLIDFTPELRAKALENLQQFEHGPLFTPASDKGTLQVPSSLGGPNWGGAAFDPQTGIYYVPTRYTSSIQRARHPGQPPMAGAPNLASFLTVDDLPLFKPPYARVSAVDMNKGEILWQTPIGNGPRHHPLLKNLALPPMGDAIMGAAPLVTKTLLFVGVTNTFVTGQARPPAWAKFSAPGWERKLLYVFDKKTGAIVHIIEMDGLSTAAPMTYLHNGKQYVVLAAGNGEHTELVAFTLP